VDRLAGVAEDLVGFLPSMWSPSIQFGRSRPLLIASIAPAIQWLLSLLPVGASALN